MARRHALTAIALIGACSPAEAPPVPVTTTTAAPPTEPVPPTTTTAPVVAQTATTGSPPSRVPPPEPVAAAPVGEAADPPEGNEGAAQQQLEAIRACESGGNYQAVSRSGKYRGAYQFDQRTWESVGGSGDPAAASEAEQDARAAALLASRGTSPWPTCGRAA